MNHFIKLPLLLIALLVTFASCNDDDDDNTQPQYQGEIPSVEKTTIEIGEILEISYSNADEDGFSYEINDGEEFITVIEQDRIHYIKGVELGKATLTIANKAGIDTLTINVVEEVDLEDNYYIDYQGIRYNITDTTASVAGDFEGNYIGANCDVDFSAVDGIITIPANIYYNGKEYPVKSIEDYAFADGSDGKGNQTIRELHFAEGSAVTKIAYGAFLYCGLSSVNFSACTSLTKIGRVAFYDCDELESIDFSDCTSLETIGESAFERCITLESVDFSACTSLTIIGGSAFYDCGKLGSIDFSACESLKSIGMYAFLDCNAALRTALPGSGWYPADEINKDNWCNIFMRTIN